MRGVARNFLCALALCAAAPGFADPAKTKEFTEEDATAAVNALIADGTRDGVFLLRDPKLGSVLPLVLDDVRVVRGLRGYGWFPNVVFHEKDMPKKKYAIDFWLRPEGDQLRLMDIRVQKEPRPDGQSWMTITRMPIAWWWIPTMERSSKGGVAHNWQVMAAIHNHLAKARKDGVYNFTDNTAATLSLELVEIHQPVGRLKQDGRYFACVDFRKVDSNDEFYAVVFWLDEKSGAVSAGSARAHKAAAVQQGNKPTQVKVCDFDGLDFEIVE